MTTGTLSVNNLTTYVSLSIMAKSSTRKKYKFQTFNHENKPSLSLPTGQQRITRIVKPIGGRVGVSVSFLEGDNGSDGQTNSEASTIIGPGLLNETSSKISEKPATVDIDGEPLERAYIEYLNDLADIPSTTQDVPNVKRKRTPGVSDV